MGCIICLEDFQDDDPSLRPACLPCGHVYHLGCVTKWLQSRPPQHQKCPTCTKVGSLAQLITLWPADLTDLDRVVALKNSEEFDRAAQEGDMTPESARKLLDDLIDFDHAMQSYVAAVHGARAVTTRVAGQKILKLLRVEEERSIIMDNLKIAMDKISTVVSAYEERFAKVMHRHDKLAAVTARWQKYAKDLEATAACIEKEKIKNDQLKNANAAKDKAFATALAALQRDTVKLREEQDTLRADREALQRDRIELRQTVAQKETEVRIQVGMMQGKVDTAERLLAEADKERDDVKEQNNKLADQLRELQRKYKEEQLARSEERNKRKKLQDQYAKLEATNKRLVQAQTPQTPSKSANGSSSTTSSAVAIASPSSGQKSQLRGRQSSIRNHHDSSVSLIITSDGLYNDDGADDDNADDDEVFPMPGLPPSKYRKQPAAQTARTMIDLTNSGNSSSPPQPSSPALPKRQGSASSNVGALGAEQLARGWGVAVGQKRKVRP